MNRFDIVFPDVLSLCATFSVLRRGPFTEASF